MADQPGDRIPGDPSDSARLLAVGVGGDAASLEALLVHHLPDLRAFVRLRIDPLLRAHEAESDLVQSVCADVLAHPGRFEFRDEGAFRNWLYGAVLNRIAAHRDYYLAQKRTRPRAAAERAAEVLATAYTTAFDPVRRAERRELVQRLERAFDRLTHEQREVLTMHRIVGLSHADIAAELGRSIEATRQLLHRAIARLAVVLREPGVDG